MYARVILMFDLYLHQNWVMWPGPRDDDIRILCVFETRDHKMQILWPSC